MNNSFRKKMNQKEKINLSNLSSTSSEFFTGYNKNSIQSHKNYFKQRGGSECDCKEFFSAISNKNHELVLYILKKKQCCFKCVDAHSNNVLHSLIDNLVDYDGLEQYEGIKQELDEILTHDCRDFINAQNDKGQTPILLAVMNDNNELAEKLESAGADPSIEDNEGNFIRAKNDAVESENMTENISEDVSLSNPFTKVIGMLGSLFRSQEKKDDLTTLGHNDISESAFSNPDEKNLDTENFMNLIGKNNNLNENSSEVYSKDSAQSSTSSEYLELPDVVNSNSSIEPNKFITLIDNNNKSKTINYSGIENTDEFITLLKDKYSSSTDKSDKTEKINVQNSDSEQSNVAEQTISTSEPTSDEVIQKKKNNETSDIEQSLENELDKYINETTSDDNIEQIKKKRNKRKHEHSLDRVIF